MNIPQRHDALTKSFLSDPSVAREFLERYLHKDVQAICNFDTLQIEPTSYVDEDLKMHCSDITYRLELKDKSNYVYVYTLIEHQNKADKLMPFRILKYQAAIIQNHITRHRTDKHEVPLLPLVAPIVFYNGNKSPYPYKIDIAEMFEHRELFDEISLGKFSLVDLTVMENKEILTHGKIAPLEIIAKHIKVRNFLNYIDDVVSAFVLAHEQNLSVALFKSAFTYLSTEREKEELVRLSDLIIKNLPNYEEIVMNYADSLKLEGIQQGMQQGMQQGRRQGMQQGMQQERQEIAKNLLRCGVDILAIKNATHLSDKELEQLKASLH